MSSDTPQGDAKTLMAYGIGAKQYVDTWLAQPTPQEIHDVVTKYFLREGSTADIGSGSGRDVHWLNENGYPCVGFDASKELLQEARNRFPQHTFLEARLPALSEIKDNMFDNVLCETVLMHLPRQAHQSALQSLLRVTRPGGTVSISWRHPLNATDARENDGRLYELIQADEFIRWGIELGADCLHRSTATSASSGKVIDQVVLRKKLITR